MSDQFAQFNATLDRLMTLMERMVTSQAAPPPVNVHVNLAELGLPRKKVQPSDGDAPPPDGVPEPGRRAPYPYTS